MNKEQTLEALKTMEKNDFSIVSDWIVSLINDYAKTKYPYNREIENIVIAELGIMDQGKSDNVATLVYNAQRARRKHTEQERNEKNIEAGWITPDQTWLQNYVGKRVEVLERGENIFGLEVELRGVCRVIENKGRALVMMIRSRTKAYRPGSVLVRPLGEKNEKQ